MEVSLKKVSFALMLLATLLVGIFLLLPGHKTFSKLPLVIGPVPQTTLIEEQLVAKAPAYMWLKSLALKESLVQRIPPPEGFKRCPLEKGSFAMWLRNLPLKSGKPPVFLYDGRQKYNQNVHHAVIDLDLDPLDLQQCADAVIRLRAEYLYATKLYQEIHFNFTSGHRINFSDWATGKRPVIYGPKQGKVRFEQIECNDFSYNVLRDYLRTIFTYAGTYSLSQELQTVKDLTLLKGGDVFIRGGFPGHAVIVVDVAENIHSGEKIFLLAQSYMPAQDMHILKNPNDKKLSPWYAIPQQRLITPEWNFSVHELKRFAKKI